MALRERSAPAVAAAFVIAVAVAVVLLLRSAVDSGTAALDAAKLAQVRTTASSFNARIEASLTGIAGLGARPWQLKAGSAADQTLLNSYNIDPNALSGYFLLDAQDTLTAGVLLRPGRLGTLFNPPGWATAKTALTSAPAVVLPVTSSGLTTELPSYAFVIAIRGATPTSVRGAFVFEQALTADSIFNKEISALADRKSSASWRFMDSAGSVIASTLPSGLGAKVPDGRLRTVPAGLTKLGADLVVTADVPIVGWRVAYVQNRAEFVKPLAGPLQNVGLIVVLLLLTVGLILTVVLARRLRQARLQEARLRELNRAQEEFISVVSHELRTPVSGVLGFLQTSLDHWDTMTDDDRHNAVRRAYTNARRLQAMTRDVLDTESIESGHFGYVRHPVDLVEEVRQAADSFDEVGTGHGVTVSAPPEAVMVEADSDRLQQVLANLLDNARKNSPSGQPIALSLALRGGVARIEVTDNGPGIEAEYLDRIFEKFVRGRDGAVSGTGLGLYISRRIVEAHEGRIWAQSQPGEPTTFVVELPCRVAVSG